MRERKLHHAEESSRGVRWRRAADEGGNCITERMGERREMGEEKWRRAAAERKLHHAVESDGGEESCR